MKFIEHNPSGNTVGLETNYKSYWEIDDNGEVKRSIEMNEKEGLLRYDEEHDHDEFGQLPEETITEEDLKDPKYGSCIEIEKKDFEELWIKPAKNRK